MGAFLQVYASSITAVEFFGSKILSYSIIAFTMALFSYFLRQSVFQYFVLLEILHRMPFWQAVFFLLSSVSFGTMIGTRWNTQSSAVQAVATGELTTALLLYHYYPIRNVVYPLSLLTALVPTH